MPEKLIHLQMFIVIMQQLVHDDLREYLSRVTAVFLGSDIHETHV
jgi:hypothetical protein